MADPQHAIKVWLAQKLEPHGEITRASEATGMTKDQLGRSKEIASDDPKKRRRIQSHEIEKLARHFRELPPGYEDMTRWLNGAVDAEYREFERVPLEEEWTPTPDSDGEGYDRDSYEPNIPGAIPELDAKAGAGEGAVGEVMVLPVGGGTISAHKIVDEWRIPPSYLREAVANPDRAIVLGVQGDSMTPNYSPGDKVIIDLSEHELRADGVYLISDGFSEPQIKRLQRILFTVPPRCKIISDNPAYAEQEVDIDGLRIMGKVAAYVGRR